MTRRNFVRAAAMAALFAGAVPAFAQGAAPTAAPAAAGDATAVIREMYRLYETADKNSTNTPDQYTRAWYSAKIRAQIDRLDAACKKRPDDMCWPDADFLVDGQDFEIKELKIREVSRAADKAVVEAKFKNFGDWRTMTFSMVNENGRWVVDQMLGKSKEQPKGYKLTEILKPLPKS